MQKFISNFWSVTPSIGEKSLHETAVRSTPRYLTYKYKNVAIFRCLENVKKIQNIV